RVHDRGRLERAPPRVLGGDAGSGKRRFTSTCRGAFRPARGRRGRLSRAVQLATRASGRAARRNRRRAQEPKRRTAIPLTTFNGPVTGHSPAFHVPPVLSKAKRWRNRRSSGGLFTPIALKG